MTKFDNEKTSLTDMNLKTELSWVKRLTASNITTRIAYNQG